MHLCLTGEYQTYVGMPTPCTFLLLDDMIKKKSIKLFLYIGYWTIHILRIHVTSPILGEHISAIILPQQRKPRLSVELNRWRSERIHGYF